MDSRKFCSYAARLLRHPTAPYHEHAVRAEVEAICIEHGLDYQRDEFGNVLVRLNPAAGRRPLVLAAHLDHPGFEVLRQLSRGRWLARFRGGVPDSYFRPGLRVKLMPEGIRAKLSRWIDRKERTIALEPNRCPTAPPAFAVWDLEPFAVRHGRIYSRACDDLIGTTSVLATLIELKRRRAKVNVIGLLSRAEEVGFHGALAIAAAAGKKGKGLLPKNALVISLETSRELPGVQMGRGVILRVGDRASIFDSDAMRFLAEVAAELKAERKGFQFQRGLMSGGTCEATAFQEFGFQSAAVCVALGNYHNCGARKRILSEYVSVHDACDMVDLLVAVARRMADYQSLIARLPQRLEGLLREARPRLRATA